MQVMKNGSPWIGFLDPGEKVRVSIGVDQEGVATLSIMDKDGKASASTWVSRNGSVHSVLEAADAKPRIKDVSPSRSKRTFQVQHKDQKTQMAIALEVDGSLSQKFVDAAGHQRVHTTLSPDGVASHWVQTSKGKGRAGFSVLGDGTVSQLISGQTGASKFLVSIDSDGKNGLGIYRARALDRLVRIETLRW